METTDILFSFILRFFPPSPSIPSGAFPQVQLCSEVEGLMVLARAAGSGDVSDSHPEGWRALSGTIAEYITGYIDSSKDLGRFFSQY